MNLIQRYLFRKVLRNIFESNNLIKENTKFCPLWFSDGFLVKGLKLKMSKDGLEEKVLPIINDQARANYNCFKIKGENIIIKNEDYFSHSSANLTKTDMNSSAIPWDFMNELISSNACLVIGTSGSGKTTLLKELLQRFESSHQTFLYSLKPEDFPDGSCAGFEPENLEKLENLLSSLKEDRQQTFIKRLLVIDEFFFLGKTKIGEEIHKHIADILPFIRASNFKMILLSQSLNKSKSKHFDIDLCNLKLINLPEIRNYQESLGHIPSKFLALKLRRGQFIKLSLIEPARIITHQRS